MDDARQALVKRRLLVLAAALVIVSELLGGIGIGGGAHAAVVAWVRRGHPGLGASLLAAAVMYALRAPSRGRRNAALLLGLGLEVTHGLVLGDPALVLTSLGGGFGVAALVFSGVELWRAPAPERPLRLERALDTAFFPALALAAVLPVELTVLLHPHTVDARLLAIEGAIFGGQPAFALGRVFTDDDLVRLLGTLVGTSLPVVAAVVHAARRRAGRSADLQWSLGLAVLVTALLHHALPAAGPASFWPVYPHAVPALDRAGSELLGTRDRTGVPSLPIVWSVLVYAGARPLGARARVLAGVAVALALVVTVGLGEHYVIDAAISVPVAVLVRVVVAPLPSWARWRAALGCAAMFGAWILLVRGPSLGPLVLRVSAVVLTVGALAIERLRARVPREAPPAAVARSPAEMPARSRAVIVAIFFASGFAGLLYEVVFAKSLALVFGSTTVASTTVLATYMGGMALGAYVGGRMKVRAALRAYGLCELGVALSCALSPLLVAVVRAVYVAVAFSGDPGGAANVTLQVLLGAVVLLGPTVLMGMTMPILARHFEREDPTLGRSVGLLYMANTAGAAVGAGLAGYALLQTLGVLGATLVGVAANLAVGLIALRRAGGPRDEAARADTAPPEPRATEPARVAWLGFAALGAGGVVSLGLEITYNHLLSVVVGNSTYAFSAMLATFLIGLSLGAAASRSWLRAGRPVALGIGLAQAGLVIVVLVGVFAWDRVPDYFASYARFDHARTFAVTEMVRFVVCACLLLPPAFFVGLSYPVSVEAVVRGVRMSSERALGTAAATNTIGNITGALVTAFALVPRLGSLHTLHALAALAGLLAVFALAVSTTRGWLALALGGAFAVGAVQPASFDRTRLSAGSNVYFASLPRGTVIDSAEGIEGGFTTVCESEGPHRERLKTLLTNGKFQGNDSPEGEMRAQYGFTLMPLLHTTARGSALVIGFGTGTSTRAVQEAGYEHVDAVELSRDIVSMSSRHFSVVNGDVLARPNVSVWFTDGRNFLQLRDARYDFVGVEITSIWFAGAASLYNVEFYDLVKRRLSDRGVFQQWVQLHHIDDRDVVSILASMRAVFEHVWLYVAGGQGVIVACAAECPPSDEAIRKLDGTPALAAGIALLGGSASELARARMLGPAATDRLLEAAGAPPRDRARLARVLSTDDNSFLEYHTPRGNIRSQSESYEQNLALLRRFQAP